MPAGKARAPEGEAGGDNALFPESPVLHRGLQGVIPKGVPEGDAVIGRRGHKIAQAILIGKPSLQTKARMFSPGVAHAGIVESPIEGAFSRFTLYQGMTEFVEDHLPQIVIGIKLIGGRDQNSSLAIVRGIGVRASDDLKP